MDRRVESFRRGASRVEGSGTGRRYPMSLRATAVEYARSEIARGGSVSAAAGALGVNGQTLTYWLSKSPTPSAQASLVPVHVVDVVASRRQQRSDSIAMTLPNGIVVSGLTTDDILVLVRGLR